MTKAAIPSAMMRSRIQEEMRVAPRRAGLGPGDSVSGEVLGGSGMKINSTGLDAGRIDDGSLGSGAV